MIRLFEARVVDDDIDSTTEKVYLTGIVSGGPTVNIHGVDTSFEVILRQI